ncbi:MULTISPECIES: alpha/beta fold hydrolase [Actinomadura]|nr:MULTISPECIES: alpha/beta fold hydrolase [Actinomadura]MBT2210825.1 alpha/beta fold hydrolase [Actinomadura sp. NEAU-AAG7]
MNKAVNTAYQIMGEALMDVSSAPGDDVRVLSVDGVRFNCRILWNDDHPQTVPVVYTHDAFARMHFCGLSGPISDVATLVQVNLPGSGDADDVPVDQSPDFLIRVLLEVMDEVPLPRVNLVGGSATGPLAYQFARRYPERVRRLVLIAAVASASEMRSLHADKSVSWDEGVTETLTQSDIDTVLRLLVDHSSGNPVIGRDAVRDRLRAMFGHMMPEEIARLAHQWQALAALSTDSGGGAYDGPALVCTGEFDALTPPEACREFAATLAPSTFATIGRADHMAHLERIHEVADLVRRFVTDQPLDGLPYLASIEYFLGPRGAETPATPQAPRPPVVPGP